MLALIPLALQLLPALGRWIGGSDGQRVGELVTGAVGSITGTTDPDTAAAILEQDSNKRGELVAVLARIAAEREEKAEQAKLDRLTAELNDTANARAMGIALAQSKAPTASVPAILTAALVLGFFGGYFILLSGLAGSLDPGWRDVAIGLTGTVSTGFGLAIHYWLGTSRGAVEMRRGIQVQAGAGSTSPPTEPPLPFLGGPRR